jgi:hypothetical protein
VSSLRRSWIAALVVSIGSMGACVSTDPIAGTGGHGATSEVGEGGGAAVTDGPTTDVTSSGMGGGGPCGDGVCQDFEDCASCFEDCGECMDPCGDGTCDDATEDCQTCSKDCGMCSVCGDNTCSADEDCKTCYEDCGICACKADGSEVNNTSPNATLAMSGKDYCDLSMCSGDVDWFKFQVANSVTAKITYKAGQGDLDIEIYNGVSPFQYFAGGYTDDDDDTVTYTVPGPGTYLARVYGASMATNPDYCFRVDTN